MFSPLILKPVLGATPKRADRRVLKAHPKMPSALSVLLGSFLGKGTFGFPSFVKIGSAPKHCPF
ncbi:hypothetical protein DLM78_18300 [Leptospira stimsonii]|uniref:Uncharacterized protein n=1 Tax=Leptospira stimsonii TaxID=2202203 RepID=A0A396Z157_9LEPT|nr:hypothetical protein DLM78_18300 [Leptospira stimsonii]RHX89241.1 hypothetical protein DLM75_15475 [Leptospira stimsonii]